MKSTDKFLIAIVVGVFLLVVIAFVLVLSQPAPSYRADDTPEGVIHNYILAVQQEDYERAYGYLSPTLAGYPATLSEFVSDVTKNSWQFGKDNQDRAFSISQTRLLDSDAFVTVEFARFYGSGLFDSGTYTELARFTLTRAGEMWKIVDGEYSFWLPCWEEPSTCK